MQSVKQQIKLILQKAIKDLTGLEIVPLLDHPSDEKHGDYSSNIAMEIFSKFQIKPKSKVSKFKTPLELAEEIANAFNSCLSALNLERVETVKPGFINFWLSKDFLTTLMIRIIRVGEKYGSSELLKNKKVMVEFTDPNPFKEFHIGHLYSNIVGESLCRLLECQGAYVWRVCYQGDVGLHVAKALYGLLQLCHAELVSASRLFKNKILNQALPDQDDNLDKKAKFLGEAYAFGARAYDENEAAKKEIEKINKQIYDKDPKIMSIYRKGRKWSLEYFDKIYSRLETKFRKYYFEGEVADIGLKMVREHIGDAFEESKGAVIFPGEKFGLHNRVFINSLGIPTYEAKDLGLAQRKYKDFPYDSSVIITANEQSDYFRVVLKALSLIQSKLAKRTTHIAHGVVRLREGKESSALKMSSRTGNVITGEWLIDEARNRIKKAYKEMNEDTAERVAVGAVKYALLKSGIGRDIAFNFGESISLEGNSGPYLQYTYARTQSVLAKVGMSNDKLNSNWKFEIARLPTRQGNLKLEIEEESILRRLHRFPEAVEEATDLPAMQAQALQAGKFAPNILCNYLFDLSQKFNLFYQKVPIIKKEKVSIVVHPSGVNTGVNRELRIGLTMAVGQILKNGLYLLGISAPERM